MTRLEWVRGMRLALIELHNAAIALHDVADGVARDHHQLAAIAQGFAFDVRRISHQMQAHIAAEDDALATPPAVRPNQEK